MSTEPDPRLVREIAREAMQKTVLKLPFYPQGITDAMVARGIDGSDMERYRAYGNAVREYIREATVIVSWPDEQAQQPPAAIEVRSVADLCEALERLGVTFVGELRPRKDGQAQAGRDGDACAGCGRDFSLPYVTRQPGTGRCEDCTGQPQAERDACDAWLDARQADIEHDHDRPGITPDSCYCDLPKPCEQRADDMAVIEQLRAVLSRRAELVAENMRLWEEAETAQAERNALAARVAELETERDDDGHRGDDASDCPACSAARHKAERIEDVRAVARLLRELHSYADVNALKSVTRVEERFADRIAALDARTTDGGAT